MRGQTDGDSKTVDGEVIVTGLGTIVIEATQAGDDRSNAAAPVQMSFTVHPAELTFTVDAQAIVYGDAVPTLTGTFTGLVNGDTSGVVTAPPTIAIANYTGNAGSFTISAADAGIPDCYTIVYVSGQLTVNRAELTIVVEDQMMTYGGTPPTLTATYLGFVNGETEAVLNSFPTIAAVDEGSGVGIHGITAYGAAADNYDIHYVAGNLTMTPPTVLVTSDAISKVYGADMPTLTTDAEASSHVGKYMIDAAGAEAANYPGRRQHPRLRQGGRFRRLRGRVQLAVGCHNGRNHLQRRLRLRPRRLHQHRRFCGVRTVVQRRMEVLNKPF